MDQFPYNPALAQKLLDEAGWTKGADGIRRKGGQPLRFTLDFDRGNPVREQTAVVARQYWSDIGVDVELRVSEFNALLSRIRARPNPLQGWVLWYITPPEADLLAYYHSQGTLNEFGYANAEVDQLLEKGRATFDPKERAAALPAGPEAHGRRRPGVFLVYPAEIQALARRVQGWVPMGYRDALTHMLGVSAAASHPEGSRAPVTGYLIRRLLQTGVLLLVVSLVVFALVTQAPGGPAILLDRNMAPEEIAQMRALLGLDQPLPRPVRAVARPGPRAATSASPTRPACRCWRSSRRCCPTRWCSRPPRSR